MLRHFGVCDMTLETMVSPEIEFAEALASVNLACQ